MSPALALSRPAINRSSVDLPQPDGPTNTQNSPCSISRSTPSRTRVAPNHLPTPRIAIAAAGAGAGAAARLVDADEDAATACSATRSPLYCAGGQPRHDPGLEHEDERD